MDDRDLPQFVRDRLRELERGAALARHDLQSAKEELDAAQKRLFDLSLQVRSSDDSEQSQALRPSYEQQRSRVAELEHMVRGLAESYRDAQSAITQCRELIRQLPDHARLEDADTDPDSNPPDLETARSAAEALRQQMRALVLAPVAEEDLRQIAERLVAAMAGAVDIRCRVDRHGNLSFDLQQQLDPLAPLCAVWPERAAELLLASALRVNIGRAGEPVTQEQRSTKMEELREQIDAAERAEECALQAEIRDGRPAVRRVMDARHILRVRVVQGSRRLSAA